jgi:hypothetical protein
MDYLQVPSKLDRIYREPEPSKEVPPLVTRTIPMGNQFAAPREFPGLHVDPAFSLTPQERLLRTNAVSLIKVSTRGLYRPKAHGDQPLTEVSLVETLISMHEHIRAI